MRHKSVPRLVVPAASSGNPPTGTRPVQIGRLLREALEAYVSEPIADDLLRRALAAARHDAIPARRDELEAFIEVHLAALTATALGDVLAGEIAGRLRPLVALVGEAERGSPGAAPATNATGPVAAEFAGPRTSGARAAGAPYAFVLVAAEHSDLAAEIERRVDWRTVLVSSAAASIARDLRVLRGHSRLVVVDLERPHRALEALRDEPELLAGALVLLWRVGREREQDLRRAFPDVNFMRCAAGATVDDLARLAQLGPGV